MIVHLMSSLQVPALVCLSVQCTVVLLPLPLVWNFQAPASAQWKSVKFSKGSGASCNRNRYADLWLSKCMLYGNSVSLQFVVFCIPASLVPRPSHSRICHLQYQGTNSGVRRPGYEGTSQRKWNVLPDSVQFVIYMPGKKVLVTLLQMVPNFHRQSLWALC